MKFKQHLSRAAAAMVCLILVMGCGWFGAKNKKGSDNNNVDTGGSSSIGNVVKVSATDLFKAYKDDKAAADQLYKNKSLELTGIIDVIGKDLVSGESFVSLKADDRRFDAAIMQIQAFPADSEKSKLTSLSEGQTVTIVGTCTGITGNIIIKDARFQTSDANNESPAGGDSFEDALKKAEREPENFTAQFQAAEQSFKTENFEKAIEFLQRARSIEPDNPNVLHNLGAANLSLDRFVEAEKWFRLSLDIEENADTRSKLGLSYVLRKNPESEKAIPQFEAALQSDPNHLEALFNLGIAYHDKKQKQKARNILSRLESSYPGNELTTKLREIIDRG